MTAARTMTTAATATKMARESSLCLMVAGRDSPVYDKVVSNLQESRARGACIIAVATEGDEDIAKHADHVIYIPKVRACRGQ